MLSFEWNYAQRSPDAEHAALFEALQFQEQLRQGQLYRCSACGAYWYLDPRQTAMTHVPEGRMDVLREWNRGPITLSRPVLAKLTAIGSSPAYYGIGVQFRETPCAVITTSGDRVDPAVYLPIDRAPVEDWRHCRLGNEIADVEESRHAVPLKVRIAAAKAREVAMGFAPTMIEMPNGDEFTLNGPANFLVVEGHNASQAKLSRRSFDRNHYPPLVSAPENVTYFVADAPRSIFSGLVRLP